jgi:carbon starvation protein
VDAFTRVGRYLVQEVLGKVHPKLGELNYAPSVFGTSALICLAWGYMLFRNDVSSIWPMFGVANQLLATLALVIGTNWLLARTNDRRYSLLTAIPAVLMAATTLTAGWSNLFDNYLPRGRAGDLNGYLNAGLTVVMVACVIVVSIEGAIRFARAWWGTPRAPSPRAPESAGA